MKKLKKDNRGVSLVMVIAAIALVTVLVTVALTMGLWNYQMKATNRISKNNFYDAERVLDEIRLGLQSDVSDAMSGICRDDGRLYRKKYGETDEAF